MYGYLNPSLYGLTMIEYDVFRDYYCRICYCLRSLYGKVGGLFVDYDLTLYSIIIHLAIDEQKPRHLKCNYLSMKDEELFSRDIVGLRLAALTMSVFNMKLIDDIEDENSMKAKLLLRLFERKIQYTEKEFQYVFAITRQEIQRISNLEKETPNYENLLDEYGNTIKNIFSNIADIPQPYAEICACVGKWAYLIDIISDYDEDYKNNAYNPLLQEGVSSFDEYISEFSHYSALKKYYFDLTQEMQEKILLVKEDRPEWEILWKFSARASQKATLIALQGNASRNMYFKMDCKHLWNNRSTHR